MYIPHVPPYRTLFPILPYTILPSRLYPKSIPSYPPHTYHVSLAFTCYSILPYHTLPYHTLNYFTLPLLKQDRNISQNNYGYPKIFGYPKMYFRISTNRFLDIHNSFLDIQKYIKIHFWISKSHAEFWISIIRFFDIQKSVYFRIS